MNNEIRVNLKSQRNSMPEKIKTEKSLAAEKIFLSTSLYQSAESIMLYSPLGNETETYKIISQCFDDKKTVLLPVTNEQTCEMNAVIYTPETKLKEGAFSINEPICEDIYDKNKIDLVLVPGIAFSITGERLGFGKGCYDRFLKDISAVKVGFCYDFQLSEQIKSYDHDVRMDYVITDKCLYNCKEVKK